MQFLVKAGIVKKPPRWLAVVEAFPPLPTPKVTGTTARRIVYKEEDKHRKELQQSHTKPKILSLFEAYDIVGMPEKELEVVLDMEATDLDRESSSTYEEVAMNKKQSDYMDMLKIIDDLKQSTEK